MNPTHHPLPEHPLPARDPAAEERPVPWWRVGVMWLVVGGPGVVVIASFALLATAIQQADTVVPHGGVRSVVEHRPLAPALQGRNHVTTPGGAAGPAPAASAALSPVAPKAAS